MCYVFVYGTLKQNEPNHHWMTENKQVCTYNTYSLRMLVLLHLSKMIFQSGISAKFFSVLIMIEFALNDK